MLALFASIIAILSCSCDKDVIIKPSDLPVAATEFITTHFPSEGILTVKKEKEYFGVEYDVCLTSGTEINFDKHGNWTQVDCKRQLLPVAILPTVIHEYITTNFPDNQAREISKESRGYEVTLIGGIELIFDTKGKFIRYDN